MVSADKKRFVTKDMDLDLSYITDRVIAMGAPAEGIVTAWRNSLDEVITFLHTYHNDHYKIFNLSDSSFYDTTNLQRVEYMGWPDHHSPPLELLFRIVKAMEEWLAQDEKNVAVVHCKAGRGRTGTVIASYLLSQGMFSNSTDALNYFASRRSNSQSGVANPSQIRYVGYFGSVKELPTAPKKLMTRFHIKPIPAIANGGVTLAIEVLDGRASPYSVLYHTPHPKFHPKQDFEITLEMNVMVQGDVLVILYDQTTLLGMSTSVLLARFCFHTAFHDNGLILKRDDLDGDKSKGLHDQRFSPSTCVAVTLLDPCNPPIIDRALKPNTVVPLVDRSSKLPPEVNRSSKSLTIAMNAVERATNNLLQSSSTLDVVVGPKEPNESLSIQLEESDNTQQLLQQPNVTLIEVQGYQQLSNNELSPIVLTSQEDPHPSDVNSS